VTSATCARSWQAEAAHDGRLSQRDVESFERHRQSCEVCEREARGLVELAELAAGLPFEPSSSLEHRRARLALLRRANGRAVSASQRSWVWGLAAAVFFCLVGGGAFWLRAGKPAAPAVAADSSASPTFEIAASPGAEWWTLERGSTVRVAASHGRFEIRVGRLKAGQRFLIELPDGHIEVVGTRFVVETDTQRTLAVRVLEGVVALQIHGNPGSRLKAGDAWTAAPVEPTVSPEADPITERVASPSASRSATARAPRSSAVSGEVPRTARESRSVASSSAAPPSSSARTVSASAGEYFAVAMTAFSDGDYGRAEQLFSRFARRHPTDSRVEDALFLRAVARARRGDRPGARALALEYLQRFPSGLRRAEAARLAAE
jgi:hypothetical protein